MPKLLLLVLALLVGGSLAAAQAATDGAPRTAVCHKTGSKTKPYQRIVVSGRAALAAHQKHADDIVPAPKTCPKTLLTATSGGVAITVPLHGVLEQPEPGDPDGTGTATLRLRVGQARVCFTIDVSGINLPASGAHIHRGSVTEAGPVVVALTPPSSGGTSRGCATASRTLVQDLLRNRQSYYVNVHTSDFPAGALRGQLSLPSSVTLLSATLTGAAERPNPGDPNGTGTARLALFPDAGKLCYSVTVREIVLPASGNHVHRGTSAEAGPVVIPLAPPNASGVASACVNADAALLREIAGNPAGFYVNVHTSDFAAGAVRGQLAAS